MAPTTFLSSAGGAPSLDGQAGSLINVLDACLVTGLSWTKVYSGTNKAAYQAPAGVAHLLRVYDAGTTSVNLRGYETMSDVDTGTGPYPTVAQQAGEGKGFVKSNTADATARPWMLIGDDRTFYFFRGDTTTTAGSYENGVLAYGEFSSLATGDDYRTFLNVDITLLIRHFNEANSNGFTPRAVDGLSASARHLHSYGNTTFSGGIASAWDAGSQNNGPVAFPNTVDGGLHLAQLGLVDRSNGASASNGGALRGLAPGLYHSPHAAGSFAQFDTFDGMGDYSGKSFVIVKFTGATGGGTGYVSIETTDWGYSG